MKKEEVFLTDGNGQCFFCMSDGKVMMIDIDLNEVSFMQKSTFEKVYTEAKTEISKKSFANSLAQIQSNQTFKLMQ